jgi:hypothetical protein
MTNPKMLWRCIECGAVRVGLPVPPDGMGWMCPCGGATIGKAVSE